MRGGVGQVLGFIRDWDWVIFAMGVGLGVFNGGGGIPSSGPESPVISTMSPHFRAQTFFSFLLFFQVQLVAEDKF